MAREVFQYGDTAAANNQPSPDGAPEGMDRSGVNDTQREVMRALHLWYSDPEWLRLMHDSVGDELTTQRDSDTVVRVLGEDKTAIFPVGCRVRTSNAGSAQIEHEVVSVAFTAGDTLVTVSTENGVVDAAIDRLESYFGRSLRSQAFAPENDYLVRTSF